MLYKSSLSVFTLILLLSAAATAEEAIVDASAAQDIEAVKAEAEAAKAEAEVARAEAETAKAEAEAAKAEAETVKAESEAAKTEAETAKAEAETAKTEAVEVKQAVQSQAIIEQTMAIDVDAKTSGSGQSAKEKPKAWVPSAIDFDWVQLTSNEWLKGEIKGMYKDNLEFDSDKLDLLDIDWEDVKVLRGYKMSNVNIEDIGDTHGKLEITGDVVQVISDYGTEEYDRAQLISFAPGGEREADLWSIKVTLGLDIKNGNTDQLDYTAKAVVKRRASVTRFVLDYLGNISKTDAGTGNLTETVNNHRVSVNYDYYKTRYFFYNPVFGEYFSDSFLNIDSRIQIGAGLGYTVIDDGTSELSFSGGPAYVKTDFVSVLVGEPKSESTGALVLRTNYDTALTSMLDFIAKYNIQYGDEASGGYTHHVIATLESEITGKLDIDISVIWDRIDYPTEDADGNVPVSDDYRMMVGVTYTY
jgi:hypothetical protein